MRWQCQRQERESLIGQIWPLKSGISLTKIELTIQEIAELYPQDHMLLLRARALWNDAVTM
jgi:hypothetical protein